MAEEEVKTWWVTYPIVGSVTVFGIEAETEDEAIAAGWDRVDDKEETLMVLEAVPKVVAGNVFYGTQNEIDVGETV